MDKPISGYCYHRNIRSYRYHVRSRKYMKLDTGIPIRREIQLMKVYASNPCITNASYEMVLTLFFYIISGQYVCCSQVAVPVLP
jgi:hypothetical protein